MSFRWLIGLWLWWMCPKFHNQFTIVFPKNDIHTCIIIKYLYQWSKHNELLFTFFVAMLVCTAVRLMVNPKASDMNQGWSLKAPCSGTHGTPCSLKESGDLFNVIGVLGKKINITKLFKIEVEFIWQKVAYWYTSTLFVWYDARKLLESNQAQCQHFCFRVVCTTSI